MSAPPTIPPRPARAQNTQNTSAQAPSSQMDVPKIPPRPKRGIERSVSPNRDAFARSPLNDPSYLHTGPPPKDTSQSTTDVPSRPPSVALPSLGEEGNEYASFEDLSKTLTTDSAAGASPQQTKSIAGDLPLHAPTASIPSATAKSRIQLVTRTDSSQAEAAGFGKQLSVDDRVLQSSKSGHSGSSLGSRPSSLYNDKEEHGIPEIGVQVPMFRNAGDVQAPSPAPFAQQGMPSGSPHPKPSGRHHGRTQSGREIFHGPPGSYGMHGHGVISNDEFEQKWYEKHPEDLRREKQGEYGPHIQENRKDYHWRADNLEKLVHTRSHDIGVGTSREAVDTPDEQIGYMASEQFASRITSPLQSGRPASIKAGNLDSPLRNEHGEQLNDDGEVIHIDPPAHRSSKIHGGGYDPPTEDLGPKGGNTAQEGGWVTERGYGMPILASDELKKRGPDAEWRQPAVSPELERHGDEYTVNEDGTPAYITKARSSSRNSSRNRNSQAQRVIPSPSHFDRAGAPLEAHKEYEPLFPEDDDDSKKAKTQVDKLKRPNLARHHFPSQDVWEDAPGSLQLETTVETPQAPEEPEAPTGDTSAAKVFESPEKEQQRKADITEEDQESFLSEETKRFAAENKHLGKVREEHGGRPGIGQRFPSQDIWEDAPSHGHLETTVSAPQTEESNEYDEDSLAADKPLVPAQPAVSARPAKKEISPVDKKTPIIPDRPKPQIPARPSKPSMGSLEKVPTLESPSGENEAPQAKAKPPVPARPGGSKIAALQAGFLKDLNSKLGLGPQAPKVKEPEPEQQEEAAPLSDARKGRAKGPQRRKPAASPVPAATVTAEVAVQRVKLDFAPVTTIWSLNEADILDVPAAKMAAILHESLPAPTKSVEPEHKADSGANATTEEADLSKTLTKNSEPTSDHETILSKVSSALEAPLAKVSSALGSDEPLVSDKAHGSVDAPGAFPVSGNVEEKSETSVGGSGLPSESAHGKPEETAGQGAEELPHTAPPSSTEPSADVQS